MTKVRLKFTKEEPVKYISHLDLLRMFNRALNRAGIPIAYSQGYNPHPVLSFAMPLAVGVTSESEYMDIELQSNVEEKELIEHLNQALPDGIRILRAVVLGEGAVPAFNDIGMADYTVCVELNHQIEGQIEHSIEHVLKLPEMIVEKEGKKGIKQVDVLPDIHYITVKNASEQVVTLHMRLKAGNESNLKPDLVLKAFEKYIDGFEVAFAQVHRTGLFLKDGSKLM